MKVAYLGTGAWGFCLASLIASKGHTVVSWTTKQDLAERLELTREHESLPGHRSEGDMRFTTQLEEALEEADIIVESVTSGGVRPVFEKVRSFGIPKCPVIITSKGIEQKTGLILPEVVLEVLGEDARDRIGVMSGPSFAHDVIRKLPTSVVGTGYTPHAIKSVLDIFTTQFFRVYPNSDIVGVCYGGALKNIVAIACGISEGLALGMSSSAALMTRGLHEIKKLSQAYGARQETLYGLSGMGDLCLTSSSLLSRNFRFGHMLAQGLSGREAKEKIGMVVEGAYSCVSALELSKKAGVVMPITEMVSKIIYEGLDPREAAMALMQRTIKEEHL